MQFGTAQRFGTPDAQGFLDTQLFFRRELEVSRNASILVTAFACIAIAVVAPNRLFAANNTPIYFAASDYREAVRKFEFQVLRTRHIRKTAERLVDQLENSTSQLKTVARDPARFDRLYNRFVQTDALHARVALTFFGNSLYPPDPQLYECWGLVVQTHQQLIQELLYLKQLRQSRRGYSVPIVDHSADFAVRPALGPSFGQRGISAARRNPDSFYRSDYTATFRPETFGPRPALRPVSPRPALSPGSARSGFAESPTPHGARLERNDRSDAPKRRSISTRSELRSAVTGAMLQRN